MEPITLQTIPGEDHTTPMNRLLSIDGGGIKAFVSIEILSKIEAILKNRYGHLYAEPDDFRLSHYFNFISGTSAGAILASYLATGESMEDIRDQFKDSATEMFRNVAPWRTMQWRYRRDPLADYLKDIHKKGDRPLLMGDPEVETLLLVVTMNASTNSTWPIYNNPEAKYNGVDQEASNLCFPVWQVVRASTAAPTFFPPERIFTGRREYEFVDGGVCSLNNPAYQMFLQATRPQYHINMATGTDKMLIVSVGTGDSEPERPDCAVGEMHVVESARLAIQSLMDTSAVFQDINCRDRGFYANTKMPQPIDAEIGDMKPRTQEEADRKDFVYLRYNPELEQPASLDSLKEIDFLTQTGNDYAEQAIDQSELPGGKLFPNASPESEPGLHVVEADGSYRKLRHFTGDRDDQPVFLDPTETPKLDPVREPVKPRDPQPWRYVLSILITILAIGAFIAVTYLKDYETEVIKYFGSENRPEKILTGPLRNLLWTTMSGIPALAFLGALVNILPHAGRDWWKSSPLIFLFLALLGVTIWQGNSFVETLQTASESDRDFMGGVSWVLLLVLSLGTVIATVFLCYYRRWILGIPIAGLLLLFFSLAQLAALVDAPLYVASLMTVGLLFAFTGIHLIWFGRPARVVCEKPVGKV